MSDQPAVSDLSTEELARRLDDVYVSYDSDDDTLNAVAARLRELQAEVERLTADRNDLMEKACKRQFRLDAERALADQLAEALRYMKPEHRKSWAGAAALAAWEAARGTT